MRKTFVLCIFLALACTKFIYAEKVTKRTLPVFSEIALRADATIHLSQGNDQLVELTGDEELINKLITEVKDGRLVVRYPKENKINFWPQLIYKKKVEIKIILSRIDLLEVTGTGSIIADEGITAKNLDIRISGTGNLRIRSLKSEKVSSNISGTGNLFLSGPQPVAEFTSSISGTGNVRASELPADDVQVTISGVGNCWVTANKKLNARISGVGKVHYQGDPEVKSSISGMGGLNRIK